jgi:hypothetical protein
MNKQFVKQENEILSQEGFTISPCICTYGCTKPSAVTFFVRFHPFRSDVEIRECEHCHRQAFYPTGETFKPL